MYAIASTECLTLGLKVVYSRGVVGSCRHKGLEEILLTGRTRRIGSEYVSKCVRILQSLEMATRPEEMDIAGYRFHGLHVSPPRWSVRVTGNYRVTFGWSGERAMDVDFEDCHYEEDGDGASECVAAGSSRLTFTRSGAVVV